MPSLRDAYGQVTIGPARGDFGVKLTVVGATSIVFKADGSRRGVYVDMETPNLEHPEAELGSDVQIAGRDAIAKRLVGMIPGELVVVGLYPREIGHRIPGCLCALMWYPFHQGWGTCPPGQEGYIVQWDFAWEGDRPPTAIERCQLLTRVKGYNPKLIWTY
jgi:hypothetical protein